MHNNKIKVEDIYLYIDSFAPFSSAMEFDNVGLLVGNKEKEVTHILMCLDITRNAVAEAVNKHAELIISHHPVIFNPLKSISSDSAVYDLCKNEIDAICAHTNLDAANGGVNDVLCELIGLKDTEIWTPENIGRIGYTDSNMADFAKLVADKLEINHVNYIDCGKRIRKVAVMGGSGGGDIAFAIASGADTLLTGEMKHSQYIEAKEKGLNVVAAGHFNTEYPVIPSLHEKIREKFPEINVTLFKEPSYMCYSVPVINN
ncbi:MAG: Nif3-like dinuclear metal center hexameric protein [Clostridia bacterium]|nr:Nif3-like dinuclear metal center hexameric protein [Clostridia bacterium]